MIISRSMGVYFSKQSKCRIQLSSASVTRPSTENKQANATVVENIAGGSDCGDGSDLPTARHTTDILLLGELAAATAKPQGSSAPQARCREVGKRDFVLIHPIDCTV